MNHHQTDMIYRSPSKVQMQFFRLLKKQTKFCEKTLQCQEKSPVPSVVSVVLELLIAAAPAGDHVVPGLEVQGVEVLLPNELLLERVRVEVVLVRAEFARGGGRRRVEAAADVRRSLGRGGHQHHQQQQQRAARADGAAEHGAGLRKAPAHRSTDIHLTALLPAAGEDG
jgi:hypothetical protein